MSVYRVIRTSKATFTKTFYLDELASDASGPVNVAIARMDGTSVQATAATGPDVDHGYAFTFQGSDTLDSLTLTWTATVGGDAIVLDQDTIEVVGGHYLGLSEIRAIDRKFTDSARYTTQDLIDRRIEVEDEFERICGQAFVPRFARDVLPATGLSPTLELRWPLLRKVRAVTVNGVPLPAATVNAFGADRLGLLRLATATTSSAWAYGTGNIVVEYEHGMDRPPTDIGRAAKLRMKSFLLTTQSPLPDRAERISTNEMGTVLLAIAKADATGIPEVDAALGRFPSPRPGFG